MLDRTSHTAKCYLNLAATLALLAGISSFLALPSQANPPKGKTKENQAVKADTAAKLKSQPPPELQIADYPRAARTLTFPGSRSWGGIVVTPKPIFQFREQDIPGWTIQALGTVKIPPNRFVTFCPNFVFFDNPHGLDNLPTNAFDSVLLQFMAMEDKDNGKGDRALAALNRFRSIRSIDCNKAEISDLGLSQLKDLQELENLSLFSTEARGAFLKDLKCCRKLRFIDLAHTSLEPDNLQYLCQFKDLQKLGLMRTGAKGSRLKPLGQCSNLQILDLAYNPDVDDSLVAALKPLKKLKFVRVKDTGVSDKGLRELNARGILTIKDWSIVPTANSPIDKAEQARNRDIERILAPISR